MKVQLIPHNTCFHPDPFLFCIHFQDAGEMTGNVHHNAVAHHLTRQRSAGRSGDEGGAVQPGEFNQLADILLVAWNGHGQRHLPVG